MKISIVTPCFNSEHTIRETIESVLGQKCADFEHIIMDGGSTDGTLGIVREYPHLIWESQKDEGHYHAMNKGIAKAQGDVIAILNADDCYRDGAFAHISQAFLEHPDWDGLFGDTVFVDGQSQEIYRRVEARYDYNVLRFGLCYIIHPTLFVTRKTYNRIGSFRYKEFKNCCDYDFILRLGREGCRIGHVRAFLVNYRYHQHGQSADLRITRNMARESQIILKEYGCPAGPFGSLLKVFYKSKRQCQKLFWRGGLDLVPGHWKTRRLMQARTQFSSNIDLDKLEL